MLKEYKFSEILPYLIKDTKSNDDETFTFYVPYNLIIQIECSPGNVSTVLTFYSSDDTNFFIYDEECIEGGQIDITDKHKFLIFKSEEE